jgi:hypothetical protein
VPATSLFLGTGIPVTDESGQTVGHSSGIVIDSKYRIEQILVDQLRHPGIPIDQLIDCTEDGLRVRRECQIIESV